MQALKVDPNFGAADAGPRDRQAAADAFYAELIAAHRDLGDAESELLNARLVLLLANHIGDADVLRQALRLARNRVEQAPDFPGVP